LSARLTYIKSSTSRSFGKSLIRARNTRMKRITYEKGFAKESRCLGKFIIA